MTVRLERRGSAALALEGMMTVRALSRIGWGLQMVQARIRHYLGMSSHWLLSTQLVWFLLILLWMDRERLMSQLESAQVSNEYGGGRMAVVIPFIEAEVPQLEENLKKWWVQHVPCSARTATQRHVDLIFYYHQDWARRPTLLARLEEVAAQHVGWRGCFRRVRFLMANLPANDPTDQHPLGSSLMFFRAMESPALLDEYRWMYWMEGDQRPCRAFWLDALYRMATQALPPGTWMAGSIVRDGQATTTYYTFADHINGNALYRLDDPQFHHFLSTVQEEFSQNKGRFLSAFDIAIYLVARHSLSFADYAAIKHRFVYLEINQNVYRTTTNVTALCERHPNTYLVHGKYLSY